ncbi:hypothetical protein GGI04_003677, partial [Coemansia thaxteri]
MKWTGSHGKLSTSVHLYTPQITVTTGGNNNILLGYILVTVDRPVSIKSVKVTFSGVYSAYWIEGSGQSRQEYYQNKEFFADSLALTKQDLVSEECKRD